MKFICHVYKTLFTLLQWNKKSETKLEDHHSLVKQSCSPCRGFPEARDTWGVKKEPDRELTTPSECTNTKGDDENYPRHKTEHQCAVCEEKFTHYFLLAAHQECHHHAQACDCHTSLELQHTEAPPQVMCDQQKVPATQVLWIEITYRID